MSGENDGPIDGGERKRRRRRRRGGGGGEVAAAAAPEASSGVPERPPQPQRQPQRPPEQQRQRPPEQQRQRPPEQQRQRRPERQPERQQPPERPRQPPERADTRPEPRFDRAPSSSQELDLEDEEPKFVPEPDDGSPAPAIQLEPDLAVEAPDLDPVSAALEGDGDGAEALKQTIVQVIGVRFVPAGKLVLHDCGEQRYQRGDRVVVDTERGPRIATIATATERRPSPGSLRKVLRRAHAGDLRAEAEQEASGHAALLIAKEKARVLDLPIKVFRVEPQAGKRLLVYFTAEDRIDLRDFLRELGSATGARIELRQIGARDEAKMVGGIGSCGQELCCTTWLPEMVPVSIKMAKDQGLVLNPTKVSGQCGRLKCCLVYEQATYAELRKGLPKLGKRVITEMGEGRVVEVDVLRRRVRVTTGPGEFHVLEADQVRPMFPSGNPPRPGSNHDDDAPDDDPAS